MAPSESEALLTAAREASERSEWQAAFDGFVAADAVEICLDHATADRISVATGWLERAERLLAARFK